MSTTRQNPDDDDPPELTPKQLEQFRQILLKRQLAAQKEMHAQRDPPPDRTPDELDVASNETQVTFDSRLLDRASDQLTKIDQALQRIERGEYDECDSCGDPISARRLQASPEATLCIECKEEQEVVERNYAQNHLQDDD